MYTDSKEIKTMSIQFYAVFLSAFLKIYWQISMCDFGFFSIRDSWKPPTYQTKLTSFEKNCHILRRSLSRENTFLRFDLLGLFHLNLNVTTSFCSDNNMICIFFWTEDLVYIFFDSKTEENNSLKWNINMTSSLYSNDIWLAYRISGFFRGYLIFALFTIVLPENKVTNIR